MNRLFVIVALAMTLASGTSYVNAQDAAVKDIPTNAELISDSSANGVMAVAVTDETVYSESADVPASDASAGGEKEEAGIMEKLTEFCLENLNYGTVTLFMAIESSFIPFPSEAVVPPAAWKAATSNDMNIVLVVLFATLGAIIGALINYFLALWLGRPIIYRFANSRIGHMCLLDGDKIKYAEEYFDKHGAASTLIGRLVPAVRQLISIPAGLVRMRLGKFLMYTSLGAGAWNIILAALGYSMKFVPGMDSEETVMNAVKEHSTLIGYCFIALAVVCVSYLAYKGLRGGKN
jgi:membrane protein DedA with SNARE-associated domain